MNTDSPPAGARPDPTDGRAGAVAADRRDPLADFRERFDVPDDYYMDGNSLGPISAEAEASLDRIVEEWRDLGIRGWTDAEQDWFTYAEELGDDLAPLLGADAEEVVLANSTTVNIHTLIGTFLDEADGTKVVVNDLDFPTDHYAIRAQFRQRGIDPDEGLVVVESEDGRTLAERDVADALESHDDVVVVFMPSVFYRSGQLLDVERLTEIAHDHGALAGFDLAHSVGVVPHDLADIGVDFAVWCSYKYLNAGPGALAGLYVNRDHFGTTPALAGWWGHDKSTQFDMNLEFTPADSAGAWQIGTPHLLSLAPLEGSLSIIRDAGIDTIREKSVALTDYLIALVDERLAEFGCSVGTPRDADRRGGHVAVEHPEGQKLAEALKDRGVVVDFRPPNVVRLCPAPLYTGFADVWDVVEIARSVLAEGALAEYETSSGGVT
ncbi:kynureninase [Salinirubrum litoreum]|uniref:Kynureninase n=1 Tax=Salinirubrum litoreum TaxID=1126234 RepID=A0ABD5R929_9EURY|nr:kynureninase [Salinirubrum litoreum]